MQLGARKRSRFLRDVPLRVGEKRGVVFRKDPVMKNSDPPLLFIADDDEDDRDFMQQAFRRLIPAALVRLFGDGSQLVSHLKEELAKVQTELRRLPDLILLDLNMPVVCGFEALKWIRAQRALSSIPVLIFSTSHAPCDVERCREQGANDYLCKPSDLAGYYKAATSILSRFLPLKV